MATSRATIDFLLGRLRSSRFEAKAMFGEYALYADGKVVALVCDDRLYVKVAPASQGLAGTCETGPPYPGAKPHYIVDEGQVAAMADLPDLLLQVAKALPAPKAKKKR
jgi:TfoX/Sxy family transcriptional regulator of competence genes